MRKKQSPDRLILRWYLVGVLFIAIMTMVICGFSVVHKANTASGFAEPETLFEIFKGEDGEVYATVFGEKYRLENRIILPNALRVMRQVPTARLTSCSPICAEAQPSTGLARRIATD